MKIKSLKLKNFKNFEEKTFEFGDKNIISGHNGAGKSAIKDAMMFGLYNRTPDGSAQNTDTFIKRETGFATVEMVMGDGNKIIREKSEKSNRLNYIDFSQTEEDARVAQRDLEGTVIPDFLEFASVFNVGYFMNSIEEKEQRSFIMKLTPAIDRQALFIRAGGDAELCKKYGINPEYFQEAFKSVKEWRHDNKLELEKTRAKLDYVQELIPVQYREVTSDIIQTEANDAAHAIETTKQVMRNWDNYRADLARFERTEKANDENISALAALANKKINPAIEPNREIIDRLRAAASQLTSVNLPSGACPTCRQELPSEYRARIDAQNTENLAKRSKLLDEAVREEQMYNMRLKKFHDTNMAIRERDVKMKFLSANILTVLAPTPPVAPEPDQLDEAPLKSLQDVLARKSEEANFIQEIKAFRVSDEELDQLYNLFCPTGLPSLEAEEKIKPVEAKLQEYVEGAKIVTMRLLKNGMEYKDTFDIELSGKRYARLSSGERKRLDFAISMVIDSFLPKPVSMLFMDDSDLIDQAGIDTISAADGRVQLFITKVTNQPLTLN